MTITLDLIVAIANLLVAGGAIHAASLTQRDRTYWPMMRVLWAVFAFLYGGSALNLLVLRAADRPPHPVTRLAFAGVALVAIGYSVWFMRKRNRVARWLPMTVEGQAVMVDAETLRREEQMTVSLLVHGDMPAAWVPEIEDALARWHAHQRERLGARMKREALARREGGIPDDD